MSLFGDLYVGTSGLQTSQEALNVVAHNITNTDTAGYVRQQVSQGTRNYNTLSLNITGISPKQTGLGVFIEEVRQVRDRFVDQSYRIESGRQGFYDASFGAIEEIEEILGELDGATFYDSLESMWTAIEELVKDPSSEVCQSMLVQYAQSFSESSNNVYSALSNYQNKLNVKVANDVDRINELGHEIYKLNNQIRAIESGGVENANDLRDRRNLALDELAKLSNITYSDDAWGNVIVKLEGHDFVQMNRVNEMGYELNEKSGFYEVFWPDMAKSYYNTAGEKVYYPETAPVFDFDIPISSAIGTDRGELKAVVLARGDHKGNWTDLQTDEAYQDVKGSIMMNVMAEFDGLVRNVVTAVNDVLRDVAEKANNITENSTYMRDVNGDPIQLFTRISSGTTLEGDIYKKDQIGTQTGRESFSFTDQYGYIYNATYHYDTKDEYSYFTIQRTDADASNPKDFSARYTMDSEGNLVSDTSAWFGCGNLSVNQDLLQYPTHLGFMLPDGSVDYTSAKALETAFQEKNYVLNPELTNPISIREFYSNFVAQIANSGNVYKSLSENQALTVESVEASRQGGMGVSTDEELSNMIKFQNAYNASSRFINVINELTEHIINTLGA